MMKKYLLIAIAVIGLCLAQQSFAAGAWVQTVSPVCPASPSCTMTISSTAAGDLLIVGMVNNNGFGHAASQTAPSDNMGGTWTLATSTVGWGSFPGGIQWVYYQANTPAGITTISSTYSFDAVSMHVSEYSGMATTNPYDTSAWKDGGFGTVSPWTSGLSPTTAQANELLYGFIGDPRADAATWGPGTGFTTRRYSTSTSQGDEYIEDSFVSSIGTYAATGTVSGGSGAHQALAYITTWKVAGGAVSSTPAPLMTFRWITDD